MNEKEIGEIRRRFNPEKTSITQVRGCYVSAKGEITSQFGQSLASTPQEEVENLLSTLKRTLSGSLGKNLTDIVFTTQQVADSDEHRLLMALRETELKDEEVTTAFYEKITSSLALDTPYMILLAYDKYDIPYRAKDGGMLPDGSNDVYAYILCSICPIKETKPVLSYNVPDNVFENRGVERLVSPPELGFLFPAFDDRCANLYSALYYSKRAEENHPEFIDSVFRVEPPMPAAVQQETFRTLLAESLGDQCSYDVVQGVTDRLREMVDNHKARKDPEPLVVSKRVLSEVLRDCEVEEEKISAFAQQYEEEFGEQAVSPKNLIDQKETQVRTPNILIKVEADFAHLVETRLIDGKKYILIRAEDGVEVNGVAVSVTE
ncbi:DUF4317 domain-containing protein [Oscillospiraceae bacterium 21-37]|jgi:hypothetical protein|uniref:DUF4317 domain-containing protein n=1 Tax=Eubacteriales TaxID=186802 RepID=UPI00136FA4D4|nr:MULTISPECIES: DUF4317 domain-containing protein [unclassified Neglectibacter]MCI8395458.1 DUF4317 domain-containing protein [Acutalibacter sp.]MCI8920460.1 DUF4317 domain-containing protein [Acutalibacter sp.]MCI9117024.1 DUF4317 domain-containing protein [Acutalibacter sp.]NBI17582.1 DUF4317 domain-containing protein [Neglectibacter sp. 59]NBJ73126.1 DUF4317 domain-containing protein [Neglectibacter sp. X4]